MKQGAQLQQCMAPFLPGDAVYCLCAPPSMHQFLIQIQTQVKVSPVI